MDKFFDNPALKSKIRSQNVKIDEMLIGYFLAPFAAMIANSIFGAYLTRYYNDVLGWGALAGGIFSAALPIVASVRIRPAPQFGSSSVNSVRPSSETTVMLPPFFSAKPLAMARPRP